MVWTLYIPSFFSSYEERLANGEDKKDLNHELLQKDWITTGLRDEISDLYPSDTEKDPDTGQRDHAAFVEKATLLFPLGRLFASFKQLDQASKLFLDAWAVSKVHGQSKIYCAHGISRGKQVNKRHYDVGMQRSRLTSEKARCQCPFEIRYSPQGQTRQFVADSKPVIFLQVKLTGCVYEHTCSMDTASHRLAFQTNGQNIPDLSRINHIVRMLCDKPSIPNHVLRSEIAHAIPHYRGMDAAFMRNFRYRVIAYNLKFPGMDVSLSDYANFTSGHVIAAHEVIDLDQPITHQNFTAILRQCMQEGSST